MVELAPIAEAVAPYLHAACRQQIHSYRNLHEQALRREKIWKQAGQEVKLQLNEERTKTVRLEQELERAKATIALLRKMLFGRQSEQSEKPAPSTEQSAQASGEAGVVGKRGQRPGSSGHGRRRHSNLPTQQVVHELPVEEQRCPRCSAPFQALPITVDVEEIHWELMRVLRRVHRKARYRPTCSCGAVPGVVTAKGPAQLIAKGKFSIEFWVQILMEKYLLQRPLYRVRWLLALHGLSVSQGTLTGGLRRLLALLLPVYDAVVEHSRQACHWHMDETHWNVYVAMEGKEGYGWWLWVAVTADCVVFLMEPSRSADVPRGYFGDSARGILSSDRYKVYGAVAAESNGRIVISFCWTHARRDFIRVRDSYPELAAWGQGWVDRINELYRLNRRRLKARCDPSAFAEQDRLLRQALLAMADRRDRELDDASLHPAQRKPLLSLREHWAGLCVFVDHPDIPMDNNEAERRLRNPVVGRKNYYGSFAPWSGKLSAVCFTVMQTLVKNRLDPEKFLQAYFQACADNGGKPAQDVQSWLPWRLTAEQKAAWALPP